MNSNHYQLFTILIGFRTASPQKKLGDATMLPLARIKNNHYKTVKFTN